MSKKKEEMGLGRIGTKGEYEVYTVMPSAILDTVQDPEISTHYKKNTNSLLPFVKISLITLKKVHPRKKSWKSRDRNTSKGSQHSLMGTKQKLMSGMCLRKTEE